MAFAVVLELSRGEERFAAPLHLAHKRGNVRVLKLVCAELVVLGESLPTH